MISGQVLTSTNCKWLMLSAMAVGRTFISTLGGSVVTHWCGLLANWKTERRV